MLLDLLFPILCQGCAEEGAYLCAPCKSKIKTPPERCLACGRPSFLGRLHEDCVSAQTALAGLLVAADYHQESIQNLIRHFKYDSVRKIAEVLGMLMAQYFLSRDLLEYFAAGLVVPVPLNRKKQKLRGFNQAEALAQEFARRTGLPCLSLLRKIKPSRSQVELEREERLKNVLGSFSASPRPSLGERKIILIDDVATTGATLNECAKVLKKEGAGEVWGLVVARN